MKYKVKNEILSKHSKAEIFEESFKGIKTDKPIVNGVIQLVTEGYTLVVTQLDRLTRNTVEGIQVIQKLFNRGIVVHVLNA